MTRPALELAGIFRRHGPAFRQAHPLSPAQSRAMRAIEICRTASLGGHVRKCGHCSHQQISYNSCRNRHCPKCQSQDRAQWVLRRQSDLLNVEYFHVVFTLPEAIAPLALQNQTLLYGILFQAASRTLSTIAADPRHLGAHLGFFAILHTWGQNLLHHPHLHCVVPGGGLSPQHDRWISCRPGFFLPVRVLSSLFRRLFLEALQLAFTSGKLHFHASLEHLNDPARFHAHLKPLRHSNWVVYAKPPFGGPRQAIEYLSRYTHRTAIANERLRHLTTTSVTFQWKDYRHQHRDKLMTLSPDEFIRRFLLHILPAGFQRIRYFGWLSSRNRKSALPLCRSLLANSITAFLPHPASNFTSWRTTPLTAQPWLCPVCNTGFLSVVEILKPTPRTSAPLDSS